MSCSVQQTVFQGVWRRQTRLEELGLVEPLPVRVVFLYKAHMLVTLLPSWLVRTIITYTVPPFLYLLGRETSRLVYHHKVVPSSPKLVINWF